MPPGHSRADSSLSAIGASRPRLALLAPTGRARLRSDPGLWEDFGRIFQQIVNEETGCLSYLIGFAHAGQTAVVDPGRDRVDEYLALARRKGLAITDIIETHVHADHVSGNQALAGKCGARIRIHPAADAAYPHAAVEDGDEVSIGTVRLKILHTPGHTPESISLLVTDLSRGPEPWFVLTGDTLFIGDVGRPDFGGELAAANLYRSLTERLLVLPDSVEVYPAHGAGPTCGRAMSSTTASTIGFERSIAKNRSRTLPSAGEVPPLSAVQVRDILAKGACVLDVRSAEEYGDGHIPGSINVWIESPQFSTRAGWFLPSDTPIVLVASSPTDLTRAAQGLGRIGLDDIAGYLQWGMTDWRSQDLPVARVPQVTVHELATMREERPELVVVDVREPFEWEDGHIEGALHLPMAEAVRRMAELPADRPKAVYCAGGLRSSAVISALSRAGMTGWYNVSGGMTAWMKAGYPTVKFTGAGAGA